MFDSAECARPRAQQAPDVRMRPISMEGSFAFLHCCARGRCTLHLFFTPRRGR
jgi:hypothetical protein